MGKILLADGAMFVGNRCSRTLHLVRIFSARLAPQILDFVLRAVLPVGCQRVDLLIPDAVIITARVGAKVPFCGKPLLASHSALSHAPRLGKLAFNDTSFPLLLLAEAAVALRLGFQYHRLARSLGFFLPLQQFSQPKGAQGTMQLE